jgi:hypothetical protein
VVETDHGGNGRGRNVTLGSRFDEDGIDLYA